MGKAAKKEEVKAPPRDPRCCGKGMIREYMYCEGVEVGKVTRCGSCYRPYSAPKFHRWVTVTAQAWLDMTKERGPGTYYFTRENCTVDDDRYLDPDSPAGREAKVPSHGLARKSALAHDAYQPEAPEF